MSLLLSDLLSRGYFPKELPPPFTTSEYSQALSTKDSSIITIFSNGGKSSSLPSTHNLIRTGGLRRNLSIPNPKHFFLLADHIVKYWMNFIDFTEKSPFSLSKPIASKKNRAISPLHELSNRPDFRAKFRATNRFLLKADISRFFPSIYTHSIPWAVMGKTVAKSQFSSGILKETWSDLTDKYSRSLFKNQTIGIPIGPDTSHLIAEVILTRIDIELSDKFNKIDGLRYIDDYEFSFATRSQAEDVLSYFQHLLNDFELALNSNKTKILDLPEPLEQPWTSKIRTFEFRNVNATGQKNDLIAYFNMVFDFFKRYPDEWLLKYAISRLKSEKIEKENLILFENLMIHCILIDPACIPQVCEQILNYKESFSINREFWSECLNRIVSERVPLGQSSEAAWAMWLMKLLDIKLEEKSAKAVGDTEDSVVGLMGLGLASIGLATSAHLSGLDRFSNKDKLFENQWLLCYQGNLMEMLGAESSRKNLFSDPAFAYMEKKNVSFFDIKIPLTSPTKNSEPPKHETRTTY